MEYKFKEGALVKLIATPEQLGQIGLGTYSYSKPFTVKHDGEWNSWQGFFNGEPAYQDINSGYYFPESLLEEVKE